MGPKMGPRNGPKKGHFEGVPRSEGGPQNGAIERARLKWWNGVS